MAMRKEQRKKMGMIGCLADIEANMKKYDGADCSWNCRVISLEIKESESYSG
jgi:hypothetical protein